MNSLEIRDAATIILVKDRTTNPSVLMGQRGSAAVFMPNKFVFPGGGLDLADQDVPLLEKINEPCRSRLSFQTDESTADTLVVTAIRELWEETGLIFGQPAQWDDPPDDWRDFAKLGYRPSASGLSYVFRAITPPARPRRFDARFFFGHAEGIANDPNDFSNASDELSQLQWIPLSDARSFDLPFITQVVLAEVAASLGSEQVPDGVPFFDNLNGPSKFSRIT